MTATNGLNLLDKPALRRRGWSKPMLAAILPPAEHADANCQLWSLETVEALEEVPQIRAKMDEVLQQHQAMRESLLVKCNCPGAGAVSAALLQTWALAVALEANGGDRTAALQSLTRYDCTDLSSAGRILFELAQGGAD